MLPNVKLLWPPLCIVVMRVVAFLLAVIECSYQFSLTILPIIIL